METFVPVVVDKKMNKVIIKALKKVTYNNFELFEVNHYTYHCKNKMKISGKPTRYYLYILLNEYTRQMYIGITQNIKQRLSGYTKDEVLGPNNEVILNALFIMDLEEISTNKEIFSINGQIMSIESRLTKNMRNLGYDARCQYNEWDEQTVNGFIENKLVAKLNKKLEKQMVEDELRIIKYSLEQFIWIAKSGEYRYFTIRYDGYSEISHKCTNEEQRLLQKVAENCKIILSKETSEYNDSDRKFIRKCLFHKGLRISLWQLGVGDIDDMIVLQKVKT